MKNLKMKLIHDKILIKPIKKETTKNGIYIPEKMQKNNTGIVVLIGNKVKNIKVGDTVMRYDHAGFKINYQGEEHFVLSEGTDIISIL